MSSKKNNVFICVVILEFITLSQPLKASEKFKASLYHIYRSDTVDGFPLCFAYELNE